MPGYEVILMLDTSTMAIQRKPVKVLATCDTLSIAMLLVEAYSRDQLRGSEWIGIRRDDYNKEVETNDR